MIVFVKRFIVFFILVLVIISGGINCKIFGFVGIINNFLFIAVLIILIEVKVVVVFNFRLLIKF